MFWPCFRTPTVNCQIFVVVNPGVGAHSSQVDQQSNGRRKDLSVYLDSCIIQVFVLLAFMWISTRMAGAKTRLCIHQQLYNPDLCSFSWIDRTMAMGGHVPSQRVRMVADTWKRVPLCHLMSPPFCNTSPKTNGTSQQHFTENERDQPATLHRKQTEPFGS